MARPTYRRASLPPTTAEAPDSKVAATVADVESGAPPQDEPTEVVEASEPEPVESPEAAAYRREAALLEALAGLRVDMGNLHSELESVARTAAQVHDRAKHVKFARLANVVAEFRNGLATV